MRARLSTAEKSAYTESMRLFLAAVVVAALPHVYTVRSVQQTFHARTHVQLVKVKAQSTRGLTVLAPRSGEKRFGEYVLYVLTPSTAKRTKHQLVGAAGKDARGIYWIHGSGGEEGQGNWVAVTFSGKNLVCRWSPQFGVKRVDARWTRLQRVLRKIS
jgi:hypothetical protein